MNVQAPEYESRTLDSIWEILEFLFTKFWEAFKDLGWIK